MTVVLGKVCTICLARDERLVPATHIARDARQLEWYECTGHGAGDHSEVFGTGAPRISLESAEDFFKRHFPGAR